jgi:hypothetical protein
MTYSRTTIDALEGRTKKADVIVLKPRAQRMRRKPRRAKCAKVLIFPVGLLAAH